MNNIDLLKMKHARLLAEVAAMTATANMETARGGWTCAWDTEIGWRLDEPEQIEKEIEKRLSPIFQGPQS